MKNYCSRILILAAMVEFACASRSLKFSNKEPVRFFNDIHPIAAPRGIKYDKFGYLAGSLPQRPIIQPFKYPGNRQAKDVNSMDEVPASSWFIPRLGYEEITAEDLITGPNEMGPPRPPITIIRVRKKQRNPRIFVFDSRNIYYMLKFDPPDFPEIATTTSFIVNRLFGGFGYHVPEDHLFYFQRKELLISPTSAITETEIVQIMERIASPQNGYYRSVASRILEGLPLGPTPSQGVRKDDPNDLFNHEDRRVLRGLHVFAAFTNLCDISSDNTLDMYVGVGENGYIKHHIVDFDDAFGTHAARNNQLWAGYNHIFSLNDVLKKLLTFGFIVEDWEKLGNTQWQSVGSFEAENFKPGKWKETHPYRPIRSSQPADDYWATKIIAALTHNHIRELVKAAQYSAPEPEQYMIETLLERRRKILEYFFERVSPVEFVKLDNSRVLLTDLYRTFVMNRERQYRIRFCDDQGKDLGYDTVIASDSAYFNVALPQDFLSQDIDYLRMDVRVFHDKKALPSAAQFHFIKTNEAEFKLVGVVH